MLIAIVLIAALLRIAGLGHQSRWLDEATTLITARVPFGQVLQSVRNLENMPPLYFLLINPWVHLTSDSDFVLRLPSALFGIASVVVMYQLGRRLAPPECAGRFGLIAALMLAVSRYHIAYSQEDRPYTLMVLLCLISCDSFVNLIQSSINPQHLSRRTVIVYILSSTAMLWTHPFSGFSLLAQNIYYFFLLATSSPVVLLRRWLTWQGLIVLLFSPWLGQIFLIYRIGAPWMDEPHFADTLLRYSGGAWLLILLGGLILIDIVRGLMRRDCSVLLALLLFLLPFAVPILISTPHHPLFVPRYGIASLIGLCLLGAGGAISMGRAGSGMMIAVLCLLAAPDALHDLGNGTTAVARAHVRPAAQLVMEQAARGDGLLIDAQDRVFLSYCTRGDLVTLKSVPSDGPNRIWIVIDPGEDVGGWLTATPYHLRARFEFEGITIAEIDRG